MLCFVVSSDLCRYDRQQVLGNQNHEYTLYNIYNLSWCALVAHWDNERTIKIHKIKTIRQRKLLATAALTLQL